MYAKHYETRGAGGETFIGFFENYTASATRELWRSGYKARADELYALLREYFGKESNKYKVDIDVFVWRETQDEYAVQPHLSQSDVYAALFNGFINGVIYDDPEVLEGARRFAEEVTSFFKNEHSFKTKFGDERMADLVSDLEKMELAVVATIMRDRSIDIGKRATLWRRLDDFYPGLRPWVYDQVQPAIEQEIASGIYGNVALQTILPEPIGLEQARMLMGEDVEAAEERIAQLRSRATIMRR